VIEVPVLEPATEVRFSAEVSTAEMRSAAHSAIKVRSTAHSATVQALRQRACRHRGRAKHDRRSNNKHYLTHEGFLPDAQDMKAHCSEIEAERRNHCAKVVVGD
jgi:hypothetical protein